jgi:hypothetical protein
MTAQKMTITFLPAYRGKQFTSNSQQIVNLPKKKKFKKSFTETWEFRDCTFFQWKSVKKFYVYKRKTKNKKKSLDCHYTEISLT